VSGSESLLGLATALVDGTPVDWQGAEQAAATKSERALVAKLRLIAAVAQERINPSCGSRGTSAQEGEAADECLILSSDSAPVAEWGPLRIIEQIGRGAFGNVYRAWDPRLEREVAVKILRQSGAGGEARARTIIHEARLLARVRHPGIVTVYGAERVDGNAGIWMEFIHGGTLEAELRTKGASDVDEALRIAIELSDAVATIHKAGVIHGDITSQNVMRDSTGRLVLTDFGAGCEIHELSDGQAYELVGTPLYVAPEVLEGEVTTPRSDIYSLGVLLYHLVTGTYPVNGRTLPEVRQAHAAGARQQLHAVRPDLHGEFVEIVERALDPDPHKRFSSAADLRRALVSVARTYRTGWTRRRWAVAAAVLVVLVGIGSLRVSLTNQAPAIAVLPLKNLSTEAGSDDLVDGLTAEIIHSLAAIDGLEVRSGTSSFAFKDKPRALREVGRQLGVTFVVEGSVLRAGDTLRVNAQLVRVADDTPLWSARFDRPFKDIFAIQDEISRSIVTQLRLKLALGHRRYDTNLAAYEHYLNARSLVGRVTAAQKAAEAFERVIATDPWFAPAYAGLATALYQLSNQRQAYTRMRGAAERAIQLDPLLAEAHTAMGVVHARERQWAKADASFQQAIALNGNLPFTYARFVNTTLLPQRRIDEALGYLRTALRIDPLSSEVRWSMAYVQISAGRYQEAIENCRHVLTTDAEHRLARWLLARALLQVGEVDEGLKIFENDPGSGGLLAYAYALNGDRMKAQAVAERLSGVPGEEALVYAGLGDKNRTYEALERMLAVNDMRTGLYLTYPEFSLLRDDPRVMTLRKKLGL
jgi:TolB-like protein/tRNA A-37 threonylcarbamoyl transferase component Bud32/Flp pilus assembly protein TadD